MHSVAAELAHCTWCSVNAEMRDFDYVFSWAGTNEVSTGKSLMADRSEVFNVRGRVPHGRDDEKSGHDRLCR